MVLGRGNLADSADVSLAAAGALLDGLDDVRFLSGLRRGNVQGALDAGLAPGLLPGRVGLDAGRSHFHERWSTVPTSVGHDTAGILTAAADGKLDVLVLLGADPLADFPDHELARRALAGARTVVAVDTMLTASVRQADVVLPAAGYAETEGTTTNLEGRVSRLGQKVTPPGTARADWVIAAELAFRLGDDLGLESVESVLAELASVSALHRGLSVERIGLDGVVLPIDEPAVQTEEPGNEADIDPESAAKVAESEAADTDEQTKAAEAEATEAQAGAEASRPAGDDTGSVETTEVAEPVDEANDGAADSLPAPGTGLRFSAPSVDVPQPDGYKLRLVTTRSLYDLATSTQESASLAHLAPGATLRLHPHDFDRLGIAAGAAVTVSNRDGGRGSITMPAEPSTRVPRGAAHVGFHQPGANAAELISLDRLVTDVRVEVAG